ncbi:MAG: type II secretion system F family protein [Candidatus Aenigmarchaeota archaeon]|nr:type II secretion system F family protein [Candidatus Aenigmarchaeota archaeon]
MTTLKEQLYEMVREKHSKRVDIIVISMLSTLAGLIIESVNVQLFLESNQIFAMLSLVAVLVVLVPPLSVKYSRYSVTKGLEETFPRLLSDITSNIKSGMTLPQAVRALEYNSYGILSRHVKKISSKTSWGIPFDKVLLSFANESESVNLKRTVRSIIEAHKSGGSMSSVLEAVSDSLYELERIKKERTSSVYSQMLNGYMIYFIFLGVMIGMSRFLLPTFTFDQTNASFSEGLPNIFRSIVVIQGVFAGLTIGKMSEGRIIAGVKHAMVLAVIGFSAIVLIL